MGFVVGILSVNMASRVWDTAGGAHCVSNSYIKICVTDEVDGEPPVFYAWDPDSSSWDYDTE